MLRVLGLIVLNLIGLAFDFGRGAQDAWAVLGEQAISIEADRNRLGGVKRQSLTSNLYSVHVKLGVLFPPAIERVVRYALDTAGVDV
jgi:hypothetical protein